MKNVAIMRKRYGNSAAVIGLNSELTKCANNSGFSHKNRDINDYRHAQRRAVPQCLRVSSRLIEASSLMAWFPMEQ